MIDLAEILKALACQRPVFHSEADFQFALAWEIQRRLPAASVRLEAPDRGPQGARYIDLRVTAGAASLAMELKYLTRRLSLQISEEWFHLVNQDARDLGRYDFVKDIARLEDVAGQKHHVVLIALLLTNDPAYWASAHGHETADQAFRIDEGRQLHGSLAWGERAGPGTRRGREQPLTLRGRYHCHWSDFSLVSPEPCARLRWLAVTIGECH